MSIVGFYDESEMNHLFFSWQTIMSTWDDNKSHTINDEFFQDIYQRYCQLIELSDLIHASMLQIEQELEDIY